MFRRGTAREFPWHQLTFMSEEYVPASFGQLCVARNRPSQPPHLLLLHGVLRNWRSFYTILPELNPDCSIAALDFRGHGGSSRFRDRYRVIDYVDDVNVISEQYAAPFAIYGHSLGAMVALAFAARYPKRVSAVMAEDPPFMTMGERLQGMPLHRYFVGVEHCLRTEKISDGEALFESFSNIIVGENLDGSSIRVRDQRDETSRRFSAECFAKVDPNTLCPITASQWMAGYELAGIVDRIECPVSLLQADRCVGGMLDDEDVATVKMRLGEHCDVRRFSEVGHSIHWSRPQEVLEIIRERVLGEQDDRLRRRENGT